MKELIVQWATILSPIIAVIAAWLTSRSTSRDAAKQIKAMQEGTQKEIESLNKLAELQVQILAVQMEMEQIKCNLTANKAAEEKARIRDIMNTNQMDFRNMMLKDFEAKKPERDYNYAVTYLRELNSLREKINIIQEQIKQ